MTRIAFDIKTIEKLESISSRLNIKANGVPEIIEKLCAKALKLNNLVQILSLASKKTNLIDLFKQFKSLDYLLTKKKIIMFFIYKEWYNKRTVFLESIIKRFSWLKTSSLQTALNIKDELKDLGLISIIRDCPQCGASFTSLPDECEKCGHIFILQEVHFKDNRYRPKFEIKITEKGKYFVNELINASVYVYAFFNKWNEYIGIN